MKRIVGLWDRLPKRELVGPCCIRCGATKAKRWTVCFATDGTRSTFCYECHRAGYEGGFSYIGDPVYTANTGVTGVTTNGRSVQ